MKKGTVFIILGILLLLAAAGLTAANLLTERRAEQAADQAAAALEQAIYDGKTGRTDADGAVEEPAAAATAEAADTAPAAEGGEQLPWVPDPDRELPTVTIDGYRYIGILEIPSRDLELPVMEEWDYSRLEVAPCRYSGSVYRDDLVICGHNYRGHFSEVRYVGIGETVLFTDTEGTVFRYTVANVEILPPTAVEEMTTGDWDLTLFTCTTGARTRRAVRCYRETD